MLKLCNFGSAKVLVKGEPNVSYICSRYYRAPELIFGSTDYTTAIDVWSLGCVGAELLLGQPLFPGESGVDQLVEIIKVWTHKDPKKIEWLSSQVLRTPTRDEIQSMNFSVFFVPSLPINRPLPFDFTPTGFCLLAFPCGLCMQGCYWYVWQGFNNISCVRL